MEILDSMAEIYDKVNLIDLQKMTEMSLREEELVEHKIESGETSHTIMNTKLKNQIVKDQVNDFWTFTNPGKNPWLFFTEERSVMNTAKLC